MTAPAGRQDGKTQGKAERPGMEIAQIERDRSMLRRLPIFLSILRQIERGKIEIELPDGRGFTAVGGEPGPEARIVVRDPRFFGRLLGGGQLGFAEMFMEGWWTTPDLQDLLDAIAMNNENLAKRFPGKGLFRGYQRLRHRLNANTRKGARRNIARHYDLGNAFYRLWLDDTMTYSSALFRNGRETLRQAQRNKYESIFERIAPAPGDRILEIGCGWGGFAEYATRERGVRVTGLTISREQCDYARRRLFEAGLAERAEIVLRDYRDERGTYDGIASIEMIEAVGEKYWPEYFSTLYGRLRPGGVAALQAITISNRLFPRYRTTADFFQKYIFPGGMLPSPKALFDISAAAGLRPTGSVSFGDSYSRTLREWRRRFNAQWDRIAALGFDDRFHRMWNYYLASSAAGFAVGTTDVMQIAFRREA